MRMPSDPLPFAHVVVRIEVPRGSFVKRERDRVEYVSPVPCPFNYGCLPGTMGADGDPLDALVLGPRLGLGTETEAVVHGVVRFRDAGATDDKLICGRAPTRADILGIALFFRWYALVRRAMNFARGLRGETRYLGVERYG